MKRFFHRRSGKVPYQEDNVLPGERKSLGYKRTGFSFVSVGAGKLRRRPRAPASFVRPANVKKARAFESARAQDEKRMGGWGRGRGRATRLENRWRKQLSRIASLDTSPRPFFSPGHFQLRRQKRHVDCLFRAKYTSTSRSRWRNKRGRTRDKKHERPRKKERSRAGNSREVRSGTGKFV